MSRPRAGDLSICARISSCSPPPLVIFGGHACFFCDTDCHTTDLFTHMTPAVSGWFKRGPSGRAAGDRHVLGAARILAPEQPSGRLFLPRCFFLGHMEKSPYGTVVNTQVLNPMCCGLNLVSSH